MRTRNRDFVGCEVPIHIKELIREESVRRRTSEAEVCRNVLVTYFTLKSGDMEHIRGNGDSNE